MRTLIQYINETQSGIDYLGYSFNDMVDDYDAVENMNLKARKEMGAKYGLDSGKTKEIQKAILLQMREERKNRKAFTRDDVKYYIRLDIPEKTKLDFECPEFILYLKDYYWHNLEEKKLTGKIDMAKSRDWNYYMSSSSRYSIMLYLRTVEWLDAHDPKTIKNKEDKNNIIGAIEAELLTQTKEFHDEFIERAKRWAEKVYQVQNDLEEKYFPLYNDCLEKLKEIGSYSWGDIETRKRVEAIKTEKDKYGKILSKARSVTIYDKPEFVEKCIKDAEDSFAHNIKALATKISDKDIDATNITVERIDDDPKCFELLVTDGNITLYARSIWAAEWSEKVTAHFRFIITDKKRK